MGERIDLNAKSPVPYDIRLLLQKAGATMDLSGPSNFRLPWGVMYTCPRINDGDKLAKQSQIDKLVRIINAGPPSPQPEPMPEPEPAQAPAPQPEPHPIRLMVAEQIRLHESEQSRLIAEAATHEKKANTYKRLLEVIEEMPDAEGMLHVLMAPPAPVAPELPPPPPDKITKREQVSSRLVYLATQSFERPFTLDQLVEAMMMGKEVDEAERLRVRVCTANILTRLTNDGTVVKVRVGLRGKTGSAQWERVKLPEVMQPGEPTKRANGAA